MLRVPDVSGPDGEASPDTWSALPVLHLPINLHIQKHMPKGGGMLSAACSSATTWSGLAKLLQAFGRVVMPPDLVGGVATLPAQWGLQAKQETLEPTKHAPKWCAASGSATKD
jgi:hypothetical protein